MLIMLEINPVHSNLDSLFTTDDGCLEISLNDGHLYILVRKKSNELFDSVFHHGSASSGKVPANITDTQAVGIKNAENEQSDICDLLVTKVFCVKFYDEFVDQTESHTTYFYHAPITMVSIRAISFQSIFLLIFLTNCRLRRFLRVCATKGMKGIWSASAVRTNRIWWLEDNI